MVLGLGEHILETVEELRETSKQFLEPTRTYQARITPRNSQFIIEDELSTYIEQGLEEIDEDEYKIEWDITRRKDLMDPYEARNLYANKGPSDRAKLTVETVDQEIIDDVIANLENSNSEYDFNSDIDQNSFR